MFLQENKKNIPQYTHAIMIFTEYDNFSYFNLYRIDGNRDIGFVNFGTALN